MVKELCDLSATTSSDDTEKIYQELCSFRSSGVGPTNIIAKIFVKVIQTEEAWFFECEKPDNLCEYKLQTIEKITNPGLGDYSFLLVSPEGKEVCLSIRQSGEYRFDFPAVNRVENLGELSSIFKGKNLHAVLFGTPWKQSAFLGK